MANATIQRSTPWMALLLLGALGIYFSSAARAADPAPALVLEIDLSDHGTQELFRPDRQYEARLRVLSPDGRRRNRLETGWNIERVETPQGPRLRGFFVLWPEEVAPRLIRDTNLKLQLSIYRFGGWWLGRRLFDHTLEINAMVPAANPRETYRDDTVQMSFKARFESGCSLAFTQAIAG